MFDWADVRIFMAVAAEGSTLGASRKLGINQTTVSRRIQALEHALKLKLFERNTRGYALTSQGSSMIDVAGQMAAAAENLALRAERLGREISGTIRISSAPAVMDHWGFSILTKFREAHPEVDFDVDTHDEQVSLERGEADIALRAADEVTGDELIARKLASIPWGLYGNRSCFLRYGLPRSIEECATHCFLQFSDAIVQRIGCVAWLARHVADDRIVGRVNSVMGMAGSIRTGLGLGALPCAVGDGAADLVCCFRHKELTHPLWIVASKESYAHPRVRKFIKFTADNFPYDSLWEPI